MNRTDPIQAAQDWHDELDNPPAVTGHIVNRPADTAPGRDLHPWALTGPTDRFDALDLLTREDTGAAHALVQQARMPALSDTYVPGAVETIDPRTGEHRWMYLRQPTPPAPAPQTAAPRDRLVSRWAADTALVSTTVGAGLWLTAQAAHGFALAGAAMVQALEGLGTFAFVAAVIFGIIAAKKKTATTVVKNTYQQEIHQTVNTRGPSWKPQINTAAPFTPPGGKR